MIDRFKCKIETLIDKPYGFQYEIVNQEFQFKKSDEDEEEEANDGEYELGFLRTTLSIVLFLAVVMTEGKDNRNLLDQSENQKLTRDDIEVMKEDTSVSGKVSLFKKKKTRIFFLI